MADPIIAVERLAHHYDSGFQLRIRRLALYPGKTYALYGPNGSGKTTLLNMLALLTPPREGRILFEGLPVSGGDSARSRQYRRRVTLLMQHVYLFRSTVFDNVASGLRFRGMSREAVEERVVGMLDKVDLQQYAHRSAHSLSGGEAQRAGLARALVTEPDVLLLDEPTASVDAAHGETIDEILGEICTRRRMTVVRSTHQYEQARRIADEVLVMREGHLIGAGPENTFRGCIETTDQGPVVRLENGVALRTDAAVRGTAYIAIAPKEVRLSRLPAPPEVANALRGVLSGAAVDGDRIRLDVDAGLRLVVHVERESFAGMGLTVGDTVYAAIEASAVRAT